MFITPAVLDVMELFPAKIRVTASTAAYNLTVIVGGFMPFVAVWLTGATGSHLAFPVFVAPMAMLALSVSTEFGRQ